MPKGNEFKLPKSLAQCADLLFTTRESRLSLAKQVEALAAQETVIKNHLIDNLPKSEATGVAGKLCRVTIVTKPRPQVEDWDALRAFVKKTGNWQLIQKRLSDVAVKEFWEAGKAVPGVDSYVDTTVSINKV